MFVQTDCEKNKIKIEATFRTNDESEFFESTSQKRKNTKRKWSEL